MKLSNLSDLFIDQLKDLYNAENQLIKALPRMVKAASQPELQSAFEHHLEETREQVSRLEKIFERHEETATGKTCKAMKGLIEECEEYVKDKSADPQVRDAALISSAQKVEHYEIAGYGTARTFAEILGDEETVELLNKTLEEEEAADRKLTAVAENINIEAASKSGSED